MIGGAAELADRPARSRTKEKASTESALHSTDFPSTPVKARKKKKNTRHSSREEDVYSFRQCLALRRGFNYEFISQKKYVGFRKRFIDFIAFVRLKIAVTWKNVVCNKRQVPSRLRDSVSFRLSEIYRVSWTYFLLTADSSTSSEFSFSRTLETLYSFVSHADGIDIFVKIKAQHSEERIARKTYVCKAVCRKIPFYLDIQ